VPGEELARGRFARAWKRFHLVPLGILMAAVVAATCTGYVVREQQREQAMRPPQEAVGVESSLPGQCLSPNHPFPTANPWSNDARPSSEQAFQLGLSTGDQTVVEGKDGWVFWGDVQANNLSQSVGRRVLSQQEMTQWASHYAALAERLRAQGVDFVIQVVPAKWDVYPEQLPDWAQELRGPTTLDYLRYSHPELPVMDMRDALVAAKATAPVYQPLNSHWTPYGGTVGWTAFAACVGAMNPKYAVLRPLDVIGTTLDQGNNEFASFGRLPDGDRSASPVWGTPPGPMTITDKTGKARQVTTDYGTDVLELPAVTRNESAQSDLSALILRDSQGNALAPGWQQGFATTIQVAGALDHPETPVDVQSYVDEHHPDIVVLEVTERFLNFVPIG